MSPPSWKKRLCQIAAQSKRVAVVGVGHELRGDDAAGLLVARCLSAAPFALVIEAGSAPENASGALRDFAPEAIILVDAAYLDQPPGSIACLEAAHFAGVSASSHTLPLDIVASFWEREFGCDVFLFGIQPQTTDFSAPLSPPVQAAAHALASAIEEALTMKESAR